MRKASEVGSVNRKTGHLPTYEHHEMAQRERRIFNSQVNETKTEGNKSEFDEEAFESAKGRLHKLTMVLHEIKSKQRNERNRLSIHKSLNESSHGRMVSRSLMESLIYVLVSGYQVYVVRKWFKENPLLGGY